MDDRGLQGWAADPFQLHEARYFSAGRPTRLVRDGRVESYDDPPSDTYIPPAPPPPAGAFPRAPGPPPPNFAGAAPPRACVPGPRAPGAYPPVPPSRPRMYLLAAAAVGIVAVTVIASVILVNESRSHASSDHGQSASPVAFVTRSAQRTLAEQTADLTMSGTIAVAGKSFTVSAAGQTDLSTDAMSFDLHFNSSLGPLDEKEILVNGSLYLALSANGKSLIPQTGRSWIQMPFQQSASADLAGSDPVSSLSLLEQEGSTVRPLGTRLIDGVTCTGYAVTPNKQMMLAGARAEQAKLGISSATANQEVQLIQGMIPPTITLWIDAQNLVREMSINLEMNVVGSSASTNMVVDFSHYGAPVTVTAPPASDTISYTTFLQNLSHLSLS
jgi:hypothetical protein